jgi:hypothetical protein
MDGDGGDVVLPYGAAPHDGGGGDATNRDNSDGLLPLA